MVMQVLLVLVAVGTYSSSDLRNHVRDIMTSIRSSSILLPRALVE